MNAHRLFRLLGTADNHALSGAYRFTTIGRDTAMVTGQLSNPMLALIQVLVVAALLMAWVAASAQANVYWTNSVGDPLYSIGTAPLNGGVGNPSFIPGLPDSPNGIAVYGTYIYWTNPGYPNGTIGRAGLDGSDVNENFIPGAGPPIGDASNVAVSGDYIYWSSLYAIGRANLDGTDVRPNFIPSSDSFLGAFSVAVDENYIYVGGEALNTQMPGYGVFTIGRAKLDGTGLEPYFISLGGHAPFAVAVNGTYIFWADDTAHTIGRAKLNGTDVLENFIPGANGTGVAVDETYVYWPGIGGIGRAKLDGTDLNQSFITSTAINFGPYGVAVSPIPIPACGLLGIESVPILAALLWLRGHRTRKLA